MAKVVLTKCPNYESPDFENAVSRTLDQLGGIAKFISPRDRVLIKPNLLSAHVPERRITTDPALTRVITKMVLDAGGRPMIGDSPAMDRFSRVIEKSGTAQVARDLGVDIIELDQPTPVKLGEKAAFKNLELARAALEADKVINLPKLKTHSQMLLTLGVKNLFGTVVGKRKPEWHLMAGVDREIFASLLLDIHGAVNPVLTVLDGVWGMEGRGPANGEPRHVGVIAASADTLAMDLAVTDLLGVDPNRLPLYRAALNRNMVPEIDCLGDSIEELRVRDFKAPDLEAVSPLPGFLNNMLRRHLVSKPVSISDTCIQCEKCLDICPAEAVHLTEKQAVFDYKKCIRCYCCQEVCPQNAIDFRHGPLVRILNRLGR
jgi:uncharacterized protein (DUF362 family)/Pyruvate/2-oxoacid:ferredoxin oxidoreductase delta subunit